MDCALFQRRNQPSFLSSMLAIKHNKATSVVFLLTSSSPKLYSLDFFFDCDVDWFFLCHVLFLGDLISGWFSDLASIRLSLFIVKVPEEKISSRLNLLKGLFQWKLMSLFRGKTPAAATRSATTRTMETKTEKNRSRSSPSSSTTTTTVPKPSQPDLFRSRHLKTDSDYYCYCYLATITCLLLLATVSWVCVTLIALGNLNLKNSGSCYLHVPKNNGLDLLQSLPCASIHTRFFKLVWP